MLPLPPLDQSASAAVNKPLVALSHNDASATLSPLGSAPETVSLHQLLHDRNTSNEITGLGPESLAGSSELDKTRLQIDLLLTSRFHGNCHVARLRLAPSKKFFANSVSLQPFDFRSDKNWHDLVGWICPSGDASSSPSGSLLRGHRLGGLLLLAVSLR